MDTIFALASARGKAGVSIVRISGPDARDVLLALAGSVPPDRKAALRRLRDAEGEILDDALVLVFGAGASFTGEDVVELHLHGSPAIVASVLRYLGSFQGLRQAEAGEFTRRALENDRMDLAQVEGLGDLIEAETEAQRRQAFRVFDGALGRKVEEWRADLLQAAALVEASIDFADEELPDDLVADAMIPVDRVIAGLEREIAGSRSAERIRDGFEVAIVGRPNSGKSTLLNRLAGRDAAIVSEIAGTTRDVIEVQMEIMGLAVALLDTAGLRETDDPIETLGVERARARAKGADLRVFLLSEEDDPDAIATEAGDIVVWGKADIRTGGDFAVSGRTGAGIDLLVNRIGTVLLERAGQAGLATRARHRVAMERAVRDLRVARGMAAENGEELIADQLRAGMRRLDVLIGRVDVEQMLGEIFSSFCIGK